VRAIDPCPCGSGDPFGRCCLPLHQGVREAATAEEVMRARYSAYAVGDLDYVFRTWHPRTRPENLRPIDGLEWTGLQIVDTVDGQPGDDHGEVEFIARHRMHGEPGRLHERSRFVVRARRWCYVDGEEFD
jgi:SEC-C motif-containing protein